MSSLNCLNIVIMMYLKSLSKISSRSFLLGVIVIGWAACREIVSLGSSCYFISVLRFVSLKFFFKFKFSFFLLRSPFFFQ